MTARIAVMASCVDDSTGAARKNRNMPLGIFLRTLGHSLTTVASRFMHRIVEATELAAKSAGRSPATGVAQLIHLRHVLPDSTGSSHLDASGVL